MYSLISAIGRIKKVNSSWSNVDISNLPMIDLYRQYEEVYAKLTNPFYPTQQVLRISDIKTQYRNSSRTFSQILIDIGNGSLPTQAGDISISTKRVRYMDAFKAGYTLDTLGSNLVFNTNTPQEERIHVALTRNDAPYSDISKYCLAVVNGLIHRLDHNSNMSVVYNANKHSINCDRFELGLLSFKDIGELLCVPITAEMIARRHPNTPLSQKLYITVNQEYVDYKPMLVLGGYLYPIDERYFYNVAPSIYCLETGRVSLISRFMEARQFGGYDLPVLDESVMNQDMVSVQQLLSDSKIIEVATSLESFLVFVKTDNLYTERLMLEGTKLNGLYRVPESNFDNKPLIGGYGMILNYWSHYEDKFYSIHTSHTETIRYNFLTTDDRSQFAVDDKGYSADPTRPTECFFLTIGSDVVSITAP